MVYKLRCVVPGITANPFNRTSCFQATNPLFKSNKNIFSYQTKFSFSNNNRWIYVEGKKMRKIHVKNTFISILLKKNAVYIYIYTGYTLIKVIVFSNLNDLHSN